MSDVCLNQVDERKRTWERCGMKRFKNGVLFEKITKKTKNYDKTKFP